jgi:hypothetical protein
MNKLFLSLYLLFFFISILTKAQTDSVIIESCINYSNGQLPDTSLSVDTFDISTGLLRSEVSGNSMTTYSYDQFNNVDTIIYFNPLTDPVNRTIHLYTGFQKDSIILYQHYVSTIWTNTEQRLYTYDSLQRILTFTIQYWNISVWYTFKIYYYNYSGNNIDYILTQDSTLQVYTYDSIGNYNISNFQRLGGVWDTLVDYTNYNSQGQILESFDGYSYWGYQYDSLGRLVSAWYKSPFEGGAQSNTNFYYSCSGWLRSTDYYYITDQQDISSTCNYYYLGTSPIYVALEPNRTICSGGVLHINGSLILGSPPVSYSWSPSTGLSSDTILNPDATPDSTTTYYLTATDSLGNIFTGCVTINVNPTPEISLIALDTTSICYGDTVQLLASSNISSGNFYRWYRDGSDYQSNNDSTSSAIQTGNYHVVITTARSCSNTSDTLGIYVDNSAQTNISVNSTHCLGDTARLSASPLNAPFKNYQWIMDSIPIIGATDSVLFTATPGEYYLVVTCDTSTCAYITGPVNIHFASQPLPDIFPTTDTFVCEGSNNVILKTTRDSTLSYSYIRNGITYFWYSWLPDSIILSINSPTYIYILASNQGCFGLTDSIFIDVYPDFIFNIQSSQPPPFCYGDTVTLSTSTLSTGGYQYQWSTGSVDSIIYVDSSGYYSVNVTDTNGCNSSENISLTFHSPPATPVIFQFGSYIYAAQAIAMQWYLDGIAIPGATTSAYTPLVNGNYTYEITNNVGCSSISAPYYFSTVNIPGNSYGHDGIFIYPSITESFFEVYCEASVNNKSFQFELYAMTGDKIYSCSLFEQMTKIELQGISRGIYFWKVVSDNFSGESKSGKIVFIEK